MGIRKLSWDNWIEMDSYFLRYHAMKVSELKKDFNAHVNNPGRGAGNFGAMGNTILTPQQSASLASGVSERSTEVASWATANSKGLSINEIHFRSERQTLRRLPRSKAVVFTVRTYFEPVTRIAQEPHIPGRLAEAIRNWDETVSFYKGKSHWDKILLPYLDEQDQLQKERGIVEQNEEQSFPY
ncbi:hypothetical protein PoHVEF18_000349 [Penicillium ochrochloron]